MSSKQYLAKRGSFFQASPFKYGDSLPPFQPPPLIPDKAEQQCWHGELLDSSGEEGDRDNEDGWGGSSIPFTSQGATGAERVPWARNFRRTSGDRLPGSGEAYETWAAVLSPPSQEAGGRDQCRRGPRQNQAGGVQARAEGDGEERRGLP